MDPCKASFGLHSQLQVSQCYILSVKLQKKTNKNSQQSSGVVVQAFNSSSWGAEEKD